MNKQLIDEFLDYCSALGLSKRRIGKYRNILMKISKQLKKDFNEATKKDIIKLVACVESSNYSEWTKHDFKVTIKRFYRWLEGDDEEYPKKVRWIKTTIKKRLLPRVILSREDVYYMINTCKDRELKMLLKLLWETGARIDEIRSLEKKDIAFDEHGAVLVINGKTGMRRLRVIEFAEDLRDYMKTIKKERIFNHSYNRYLILLKKLARKIGKDISFHTFRHSRATYLANFLTEFQMKAMFGWSMSSRMPEIYVHLSGKDVDRTLILLHKMENDHNFTLDISRKFNPPKSL